MDATVRLDRYVIWTLMRDLVGHDRRPSAYLVYLALVAAGERASPSLRELAELTGLSKRSVQGALRHLQGRALISIERKGLTEAATITPLQPWRRG